MRTIHEQFDTPVAGEHDVVVVGGGASGTVAAIAAARAGARTLLIERGGCLGGAATTNLVAQWVAFFYGDTQVLRGIPDQLRQRVERAGGANGFKRLIMGEAAGNPFPLQTFPFNPEVLKIVLDQAVEEAGVRVLFHVTFSKAIRERARVSGVVVETVEGRRAYQSKVVVDASGDAVVCADAGVPCMGEEAGLRKVRQPCSLSFRLSNVDVAKFRTVPSAERRRLVLGGLQRGELFWESISFVSTPGDTDAICLMSRITGIDAISSEDVSRAEAIGRKQIASIVKFLNREMPGFERAILADIAARVGIRETRRIRGEYMLTHGDIMGESAFQDSIALGAGPMDEHDANGTGIRLYAPTSPFEIPLRTLIPVGVEGLLASGRNLCADRDAFAGVRHMGTCMALGEAVGNLAALAATSGRNPASVPASEVQDRLDRSGALYRRKSLQPAPAAV